MRACDGCTKCCEGWLRGVAHGQHFWPGRKCHFLAAKGCSIYEDRPENPCKIFKCLWLTDEKIPMWMKPNQCGAIIMVREIKGHKYIDIVEAGQRLDPTVLSWFFLEYAADHIENICYQLDGGKYWIGTEEFIKAVES